MFIIPGTWQQVLIVTLLVLIVLGIALCVMQRRRRSRIRKPRAWPMADYSAAYAEKRQWLGRRFLLASPINRRLTPVSETESVALLRRADHARLGF